MGGVLFVPGYPQSESFDWMQAWAHEFENSKLMEIELFVLQDQELFVSNIIEELEGMSEPRLVVAQGLGATAASWALSHEKSLPVEGCLLIRPVIANQVSSLSLKGFNEFPHLPALTDAAFVSLTTDPPEITQQTLRWAASWGGIYAVLPPIKKNWVEGLSMFRSFCLKTYV
jgi:predicted alpha/beta hydrolase family esterase